MGPMGPRGFNGSNGAPGANGTRGVRHFSFCFNRTKLQNAAPGPNASNDVLIKEIAVRIVHIVYVVHFPFAVNFF